MEFVEIFEKNDDFYTMVKMDNDLFDRPWTLKSWEMFLDSPHYHCYVLKNENEIIGLSCYFIAPKESSAHMLKIFLKSSYRAKGHAEILLGPILNYDSCFLEVDEANKSAIGFYLKHGFRVSETISGFYSNGSSALRMIRP